MEILVVLHGEPTKVLIVHELMLQELKFPLELHLVLCWKELHVVDPETL